MILHIKIEIFTKYAVSEQASFVDITCLRCLIDTAERIGNPAIFSSLTAAAVADPISINGKSTENYAVTINDNQRSFILHLQINLW